MNAVKLNQLLSQVALTFIAIVALFIFSHAGVNKEWFAKVVSYWDDYQEQRQSNKTIEEIREERLGPSYKISKMVRETFEARHIKNPVILLEPNTYVEKTMGGIKMPEPIIFYYFTGIKALWTNSTNVNEATHILRLKNGQMQIDTISSPGALKQILNFYKPYPQSL
ncbi:hypothetical protein [Taibaiella koreensis]|uniref:hypothetical protein n=1 Tax=Taibaiella koreensis TaxID=1268548 RepID=UPI000E59A5D4|nr:hypothetical protein [Taibaiella koreensis]